MDFGVVETKLAGTVDKRQHAIRADEQPQLGIVERTTIDFLDRYLGGSSAALGELVAAGNVAGTASLTADTG